MRTRRSPRLELETLEGRILLASLIADLAKTVEVTTAQPYILDGTLTDLGFSLAHASSPGGGPAIPGQPAVLFFTTDQTFGRLKSPGQVGGFRSLAFAKPVVDQPPGTTPRTYPEPVTIVYGTTVVPNISGATLTLNQVVKKGKHLSNVPSKGTFTVSIGSSTTNVYRFAVTAASGQFARALGESGTLTYNPAKRLLQIHSDR